MSTEAKASMNEQTCIGRALLTNPSSQADRCGLQVGREDKREQHSSLHDCQHLRERHRDQGASPACAERPSRMQAEVKGMAAQDHCFGNRKGGDSAFLLCIATPGYIPSSLDHEGSAWEVASTCMDTEHTAHLVSQFAQKRCGVERRAPSSPHLWMMSSNCRFFCLWPG